MNSTAASKQPGRLGTFQEAAERIAVDPMTVRRMVSRGVLTAYRIPGTRSVRVDLDELDAILRPIPTVTGPDAA